MNLMRTVKCKCTKNTIKSKKTAEENLFSPITLGDVVMGAIAYGTMEDTKNEYNEYSSDVRTYIEAAEEEKQIY